MTAKVLKDDGQHFERFFREHYKVVRNAALSVTQNVEDAEDVVQTVFLKVLQLGDEVQFAQNVKGYLFRAAVNEARALHRARARQSIEQDLENVDVEAPTPPRPLIESIDDRVLDAILQVGDEYLYMLVLQYEHGWSAADIAEMYRLPRGQVAVMLHRALVRLKKLLMPDRFPDKVRPNRLPIEPEPVTRPNDHA